MQGYGTGTDSSRTAQLLASAILQNTSGIGLRTTVESATFGDIARAAAAAQQLARSHGVGASDVVVVYGQPTAAFYGALLGGIFGQYLVCPVSPQLPAPAKTKLLRMLEPALVLGEFENCVDRDRDVRQIPLRSITERTINSELDVVALAASHISTTSGTLGQPTCVVVDSAGLAQFLSISQRHFAISASDRWLELGDHTSDLAINNWIMAWAAGATYIPVRSTERLQAVDIMTAMRPTIARVVPAHTALLLARLGRARTALGSVHTLAFGGDRLKYELVERLSSTVSHPIRIFNTYGKTEIAGYSFVNNLGSTSTLRAMRHKSTFVALGNPTQVTIPSVDRDNSVHTEVPQAHKVGELVIRSSGVALRLLKGRRQSWNVLKSYPGEEAEIRTGDLVAETPDGLQFIGRRDRLVKVAGVMLSLDEFGSLLSRILQHEVVMLQYGEKIVALTEQDLSLESIAQQAEGVVPSGLLPRQVIVLKQLPRNRSSKVDLAECQRIAEQTLEKP